MYKGNAVVELAEKHLNERGAEAKKYCGLGTNDNYCDAFVTWMLYKTGAAKLYCGGTKQVYCPTSIKWCYDNLAAIPPYLALPGDIIFFDWEPNGNPNHVGVVRKRLSAASIYTVEGNTSKTDKNGRVIATGVIAKKTRTAKYIQGIFRLHYPATFDSTKPLVLDGKFGFSSIAMLQVALGLTVSGILTKGTVKALQKKAGTHADGDWGKDTSKAIQRMVGVKDDGNFGPESVKALQAWINKKAASKTVKKKAAEKATATAATTAAAATKTAKKPTGAEKVLAKCEELAWKKGTKASKYSFSKGSPTATFKKAFNEVFPSHGKWGRGPRTGASCDVGAATVIRAAGLDKSMPRGYTEQLSHKASSKMKKIVKKNVKPYDVTKPGDMILYTKNKSGSKRHVLIRGKGCLYEAQYQKTFLHVNKSMSKIKTKRPKVVIFRPK